MEASSCLQPGCGPFFSAFVPTLYFCLRLLHKLLGRGHILNFWVWRTVLTITIFCKTLQVFGEKLWFSHDRPSCSCSRWNTLLVLSLKIDQKTSIFHLVLALLTEFLSPTLGWFGMFLIIAGFSVTCGIMNLRFFPKSPSPRSILARLDRPGPSEL